VYGAMVRLRLSVHRSAHGMTSISRAQVKKRRKDKGRSGMKSHTHPLPIQEKSKVGAAATPYSGAAIEPIPAPKWTLANATWPASLRGFAFSRTSSSNTGSFILHGRHVADVNIATTARCEVSEARNDVGFVDAWIAPASGPGAVCAVAAYALVEGAGELYPESYEPAARSEIAEGGRGHRQ
jgi:hypothetical protein